jgi:hypothetical protein
VQSCIPPNFKIKCTPCISHTYTSTIASKLFNYKQTLLCLDIEQFRQNPPKCSCSCSSPFIPLRIRVRIDPPHPLVFSMRRLNGANLRIRPEKLRSCVTASGAR